MNKVKGVAEKDHGSLKAMKPYIDSDPSLGAICMCIAASASADPISPNPRKVIVR